MRARLWTLAAGLVLAGLAAPAMASVAWSGAAWYISINLDYNDGAGPEEFLNYGPYSSEADCTAAWSKLSPGEQHAYGRCVYFEKDPDNG